MYKNLSVLLLKLHIEPCQRVLRGRCWRIPGLKGEIKSRRLYGSSWQSSTSASQLCKNTQNLIKRVHFLYKAFYGPRPLLRYIYFFHQSHQNLRVAARGPPGSFLLYKFFTPVLLLGVDFHSVRMQPDPPRPLSALSAPATMKNYCTCRPLFLLFPLLSSSWAPKREFQDKLMDILGHPRSGLRKMHQIL